MALTHYPAPGPDGRAAARTRILQENGPPDGKRGASSVDKVLTLLAKFAMRTEPWSVDELARDLNLPQSTVYRYLKSLAESGLVVAVSAGSYILGPAIIMLDRQMRLSDPLILSGQAAIDRLRDALDVPGTLLLCRLFRDSVMCVHSREVGNPRIEVSYARGRPLPLFRGAASKVILASMPLRSVRAFFDGEPQSFERAGLGSTWLDVKRSLRAIRGDGFAVTRGEVDRNALGLASPIVDGDGTILGSLGFVTAATPEVEGRLPALVEALRGAAAEVHDRLAARRPARNGGASGDPAGGPGRAEPVRQGA